MPNDKYDTLQSYALWMKVLSIEMEWKWNWNNFSSSYRFRSWKHLIYHFVFRYQNISIRGGHCVRFLRVILKSLVYQTWQKYVPSLIVWSEKFSWRASSAQLACSAKLSWKGQAEFACWGAWSYLHKLYIFDILAKNYLKNLSSRKIRWNLF